MLIILLSWHALLFFLLGVPTVFASPVPGLTIYNPPKVIPDISQEVLGHWYRLIRPPSPGEKRSKEIPDVPDAYINDVVQLKHDGIILWELPERQGDPLIHKDATQFARPDHELLARLEGKWIRFPNNINHPTAAQNWLILIQFGKDRLTVTPQREIPIVRTQRNQAPFDYPLDELWFHLIDASQVIKPETYRHSQDIVQLQSRIIIWKISPPDKEVCLSDAEHYDSARDPLRIKGVYIRYPKRTTRSGIHIRYQMVYVTVSPDNPSQHNMNRLGLLDVGVW